MEEQTPRRLDIEDAWYRQVPPSAVPVPAAHMPPDLHGHRGIVADPDVGIITDLRIIGTVRHGSDGAVVDVLPEIDYWRSRIIPDRPVYPRRVPLERLYVEHRLPYEAPTADQPVPPEPSSADAGALLRRLAPAPDQPGARIPVPARTVTNLHGRRVIQSTQLGFAWNLRAISEPYETADHDIRVNLCGVEAYFRWVITGVQPEPVPVDLYLLWTE
ncbi:hypothetical protein QIS99_28765 [Streptomyces sp. B-S-A8]|uniref:Uncharacterized protein n=1 Tax=Streptomyces solicavernae TaxID=3043614 RepID=A0ABT6S0E3_9ACTN|nr:hypothetical protein [Streptomyces sp. B-S-A8]MDI3390153.1 hypothetical protein [Streptomyces sp. B-S-A8]